MICPECAHYKGGGKEMSQTNLGNPCCNRCGYIKLPDQVFFDEPKMIEFRLVINERD